MLWLLIPLGLIITFIIAAHCLNRKGITPGLPDAGITRTPWTEQAEASPQPLDVYPRPAMVRTNWQNLNGTWALAFTRSADAPQSFPLSIRVPFSPQSPLSGVHRQLQPDEYLWYRRELCLPAKSQGRLLLHFGAVDQECEVFMDGKSAGQHSGGYLPFTVDLTNFASETPSSHDLTVRVRDVSEKGYLARGKQQLGRGGMYYTAQSGIWQTVWLECVPQVYIRDVRITPEKNACRVEVSLGGGTAPVTCAVYPHHEALPAWRDHPERLPVPETGAPIDCAQGDVCTLHIPQPRLWSPDDPYLYRVVVTCGEDRVECYTGLRVCAVRTASDGFPRFYLNDRPMLQVGLLDQGYWPDGLYTAACDEAMINDIRTMKELGFNLLRKHIKIEPQRWYYHCDRLGMQVWQDMVNGGSQDQRWFVTYAATLLNVAHISIPDHLPILSGLFSRTSREGQRIFEKEMLQTAHILYNHPSVVTWVIFNEGWGQFNANHMTKLLRAADSTRWIDQTSGWFDQRGADVVSYHHYFFKLTWKPEKKRVMALSEFGGITLKAPGHIFSKGLYGYETCESSQAAGEAYQKLWNRCTGLVKEGFCAFVYTQVSDVEEEHNGLLTYDRELLKIDSGIVKDCCRRMQESMKGIQ